MHKKLLSLVVLCTLGLMVGCTAKPLQENYDLKFEGMVNVTTGDGTFKDYKAQNFYQFSKSGTKIILGLITLKKVPKPREVIADIVKQAKADGNNAIINMSIGSFTPGMLQSIMVAHPSVWVSGTGIKVK